jgi:hypothetical protein
MVDELRRDFLPNVVPGRMPLPLAWGVATAFVPFVLIVLANMLHGTLFDELLFFGLLVGGVTASIIVARLKRRSVRVWALLAGLGIWGTFLLFGPFFQPVTVATAVALSRRVVPASTVAANDEPAPDDPNEPGEPATADQRRELSPRDWDARTPREPETARPEGRRPVAPRKPLRPRRRARR